MRHVKWPLGSWLLIRACVECGRTTLVSARGWALVADPVALAHWKEGRANYRMQRVKWKPIWTSKELRRTASRLRELSINSGARLSVQGADGTWQPIWIQGAASWNEEMDLIRGSLGFRFLYVDDKPARPN